MEPLTTDESLLYEMSAEDFARHCRAVEQYSRSAQRDLADFSVVVLGLPPASNLQTVRAAAAAAGMVPRAREILARIESAEAIERACRETVRRRGLDR